jgi:hypothetical protein
VSRRIEHDQKDEPGSSPYMESFKSESALRGTCAGSFTPSPSRLSETATLELSGCLFRTVPPDMIRPDDQRQSEHDHDRAKAGVLAMAAHP